MKKKKLLFVCYGLGIGGIETCLVNLINVLPETKFDIDVLLMNPEYSSINNIRRSVCFLDSFEYVMNTTDTLNDIYKHGGILKNFNKFCCYCLFRLRVKFQLKPWKSFKKIQNKYDIAIAYSQNDFSPYFVIDNVIAHRKVMWYHNGVYEKSKRKFDRDKIYYGKFDYVVAVSTDCKEMLKKRFNFLNEKLIVLQNITDALTVRNKANKFKPKSYLKDKINIVSVGRMTKEKGAELAVEICLQLHNIGIPFKWHWIGDGNQRREIENKVSQYNLQNEFIFEGNQDNPYPYIKNADIYIQPSYYEAYSTTVTEAKILNRPIIVTDVGGMRDQIINNVNGLIVPISSCSLKDAILYLIEKEEVRIKFSEYLVKEGKYRNNIENYYKSVLS